MSFYRSALAIAVPVMLQQLIMSMVSLIDNFMVAGLGDIAMAAVNVTNQIGFIFIVVINTICMAGGIYIAQFKGANDSGGMQQAFRFKVLFSATAAIIFIILFRAMPGRLLSMMTMGNAEQAEIVSLGSTYMRLIAWSLVPMAISFSIGTSFREIAQPKIPLFISIAATLLNTFGNWVFIYGNLGAPRLEVVGAAYTTIISRVFEMTIFLIYAAKSKPPFFVDITKLFNINIKFIK
jgi:Na+-driven multidrug efflux pump